MPNLVKTNGFLIAYPMRLRYILIFIALTLIYFRDAVFKNLLLAAGDGLLEFYPLRVVFMDMIKEGLLPLWNPYMFIGFPLMASIQPGAFYPPNYLLLPFSPESAFNLGIFIHIFLSGYFTFLYIRLISGRDLPAVMAGIGFAFLGFIATHLHQPPIQATAIWLPLILYFIEKLRITSEARYSIYAGIAIAFQVYAGHPATLLQSSMLISLYVILHFFHTGISRGTGFLLKSLISAVIGIALSLPQLIATFELTRLAFRAELRYEIFSQLPFPPHMLPAMLFPFFFGIGEGYWGPPSDVRQIEGFIGILPVLLAGIVIFKEWRSNIHVRLWGIIAVIAFALSLGENLSPLHKLMYHVPLYNLFRAPVRHLYEVSLALTVISSFGISRLTEMDKAFRKTAIITIITIIGITVLLSLFSEYVDLSSLNLLMPERFSEAVSLTSSTIYVPLVFMSFYLIIIFFLKWSKGRGFIAPLLVLILFSEAVYFRAGQNLSFPEAKEIKSRQDSHLFSFLRENRQRTAFIFASRGDNVQNLLPITRRISMLNGYDPLIIKDFSDLLDMEGIGFSHEWDELIKNNIILSMLGTKYLIVPKDKEPLIEAVRGKVTDEGYMPPIGLGLPPSPEYQIVYERLFDSERGAVYLNRNCLPEAFSVIELIEADSIDDVSRKLYTFRINPRRQAMLSKEDIKRIGQKTFGKGSVEVARSKPNKVTLNADFLSTGFVVLSDEFYPGWRAYVDGKQTEIYKTNGVIRGVIVPEGRHEILFKYIPAKIYMAMALSGIALGAIFLIIFYRPKNKDDINKKR